MASLTLRDNHVLMVINRNQFDVCTPNSFRLININKRKNPCFQYTKRILSVRVYVCTHAHFKSPLTTGRSSIKLSTIKYLSGLSVIITLQSKITFINLHFLTQENRFLLKRKPAPSGHLKKKLFFVGSNDVTIKA